MGFQRGSQIVNIFVLFYYLVFFSPKINSEFNDSKTYSLVGFHVL